MSAISVMKIRDVLLVQVPADPDDRMVNALQENILEAMHEHEPRGLVLDISAVEIIDSFFARVIAETGQMVALMGGRTIIAGMRPSVAITTVQLGLTLGGAEAALTVDDAFDRLESRGS